MWRRRLRWCSQADVLTAFHIVSQEIRQKCRRFADEGLSQADACGLAGRIREQRELVRQLIGATGDSRLRRLLKLNKEHRRRLIELAGKNCLDTGVLNFR